jgi:hypothetical protein
MPIDLRYQLLVDRGAGLLLLAVLADDDAEQRDYVSKAHSCLLSAGVAGR